MSDLYEGINLAFRPPPRFFPMTAEKFLLSRVKGIWRRDILEMAIEEDRLLGVDPFFTSTSLSKEDRRVRSAIHPRFTGGEYLPDFEEGEVEVARIELASVTGDVISIRGSQTKAGFRYRVVDEYENECLLEPNEIIVEKPLCLEDLGKFLCRTMSLAEILSLNELFTVQEAKLFLTVKSTFYPQFSTYLFRTIDLLLLKSASDAETDKRGKA
jgi:hypothetical protein